MAITKISAILLVVGLVVGVVAGYGAGFAVYQPEISKIQSDLSTAQSTVTSLEADVETYKRLHQALSLTLVEVEVGQEFTITLESNPTTGYQWQLAKPLDEGILKFIGSEYKAPETELLGAGGKEVWTFKAVNRGIAEISLKYVRLWEKDVPPAKEQTFAIIVK